MWFGSRREWAIVRACAVAALGLIACLDAHAITERTRFIGSDTLAGDLFGVEVQVSGDSVIIGAHRHDGGTVINGGAAYVFRRCGSAWQEEGKLVPPSPSSDDLFGWTVSISGDSAVVGAYQDDNQNGQDAGAAYVFTRSNGVWTFQAKLTADDGEPGDQFAWDVWINGDTVIAGAVEATVNGQPNAGAAYVFTRTNGVWAQQAKLLPGNVSANAEFGRSVSVSGDTAAIGAAGFRDFTNGADRAYIFTRTNGVWGQQAVLQSPDSTGVDHFGLNVSLSGDSVVIGAERHDTVDGTDAGAAYVFRRVSGIWGLEAKLTASDALAGDRFGFCAEIVGDYVAVGAIFGTTAPGVRNGKVYVFKRDVTTWNQVEILTASEGGTEDQFGNSVAIQDDLIIVGAVADDFNGVRDSGSAYLFQIGTQPPSIDSTYPVHGTTYPGGIVTLEVLDGICGTPVPLDVVVADVDGKFLSTADTLPYVGWYLRGSVLISSDTSDPSVPVLIESPCPLPPVPNAPIPADRAFVEDSQVALSWNGLAGKTGTKLWQTTTESCAPPLDLAPITPADGQVEAWNGMTFLNSGITFSTVPGATLYIAHDEVNEGVPDGYIMSSYAPQGSYPADAPTIMDFTVPVTCVGLYVNDVNTPNLPWAVAAYDKTGYQLDLLVDTATRRRLKLETPGISKVAFYPSSDWELLMDVSFEPIDCPVTYDVYLGASPAAMTKICADITDTTCQSPDLNQAEYYYWQVVAKSGRGEVAGPVWQIIRTPDIIARNDTYVISEDASTTTLPVLDNDTAPAPLEIIDFTVPTDGTLTKTVDNKFLYTPPANFNGSVTFLYTVDGVGEGFITTASVVIVVLPQNDPPVVNYPVPDLFIATNGGPLGLNAGLVFKDIDGDILDYTVSANSAPTLVDVVRSGAGFAINVTPDANGVATITIRATDPSGAFAEDTFIVTVGTPPTPTIITQQPAPQTVNYQQDAQFTCAATSNVSLSYQWQRNGADLLEGPKYSGTKTPQLDVIAAENPDEGSYRCRISNGASSVFTQTATLAVRDPYIAGGPDDATGGPGGTATFLVDARGSGTLTYQWYIGTTVLPEGTKYSGTTGPQLTVHDLVDFPNNSDEQLYHCEVRGADPAVARSRSAWLNITDPAIIVHPTPLTVREGTDAQFRIVAIGTPPILYRWRKDGVNLSDDGHFSGTRTPMLTISGAQEGDEGDYSCTAIGQEIVESRSARLTVTQIPEITGIRVTPEGGIVRRGDTFTVEVLLDGPADGLAFSWARDGNTVSDDVRISGSGTPLLMVSQADDPDAGNYVCTVSKDSESLQSPPGNIRVGLAFLVDLPDASAENGQRFSWGTVLTGESFPVTYSWFRQGNAKAFERLIDDGRIVGAYTNVLTFDPVEFSDAGQYTVYALDGVDIAVSRIATLTVLAELPAADLVWLTVLVAGMALLGARRRGDARG